MEKAHDIKRSLPSTFDRIQAAALPRYPGRRHRRRDAQRSHNISANLIQLWLTQFDRGDLTDEEAEASVIAEYEARIAALERKVGQLTMELDLAKKTPRMPTANNSEKSFVISGPGPAPSGGGAKP